MTGESQDLKRERVWDPLVRLFHWSLVAAFATAWWGKGEAWIHEGAGKFVLILIIYRTVWGLIGPGSARFENFLRGPVETFKYCISIVRGKPRHYAGHNPAGAAMIAMMLLTLTVTAVSGILMSTVALWGNAWIELVHGTAAYAMLFLIGGHVCGILAAAVQHRENLVWSMITGKKYVPSETLPYLGRINFRLRPLLLSFTFVAIAAAAWFGTAGALNASAWRMHKTIAAELVKLECADAHVETPRVEIFPAVRMKYDIKSSSLDKLETVSLNASQALAKRPEVDFSSIASWCADIRERAILGPTPSASSPTSSLQAASALPRRAKLAFTFAQPTRAADQAVSLPSAPKVLNSDTEDREPVRAIDTTAQPVGSIDQAKRPKSKTVAAGSKLASPVKLQKKDIRKKKRIRRNKFTSNRHDSSVRSSGTNSKGETSGLSQGSGTSANSGSDDNSLDKSGYGGNSGHGSGNSGHGGGDD